MRATEQCYVVTDGQILSGEPFIRGTRTPVRAIVESWRKGPHPWEVRAALPYLATAQVFAALSYSRDHLREINEYIGRNRIPVGR